MRHSILFLTIAVFILSCKEKSNSTEPVPTQEVEVQEKSPYPKALEQVFDAHGGIALWRKQKTLTFVMPKPDNPETHITDLYSREDKIETPGYDMGFDGTTPWLLNKGRDYQGNVEFYHNLMFYFYAMPFVLADDGINYDEAPALNFEGKTYPGIKISYEAGVGTSPKDEYYLHYNPETYKMEWLGYTVTYRTGEDSYNVKWIRYDDWGIFNGLQLPNAISWYTYEGMNIKELRNTVKFEQVKVSNKSKPTGFYDKPEGGTYFMKTE